MSSQVAKALNGSDCIISIGARKLAYGSSISFSEDFANTIVGSLGSSSGLAVEPIAYSGGAGSFTISRYAVQDAPALKAGVERPKLATAAGDAKDNSFYSLNAFSPARVLLDCSFDITIEYKTGSGDRVAQYKLVDCLLTGFDISFNPGGISSESVSFECRLVIDSAAEPNKQQNNNH